MTGTPIQNRLEDFGALLSFLRVHPLNSESSFRLHIVKPIESGQDKGIAALRRLINSMSLRRTKASLADELQLPPRLQNVHLVELDKAERTLYDLLRKRPVEVQDFTARSSGHNESIFTKIMKLRRICNHGLSLLPARITKELENDHVNADEIRAILQESESCERCGCRTPQVPLQCLHLICSECISRSQDDLVATDICPLCPGNGSALSDEPSLMRKEDVLNIDNSYRPSTKVLELLQTLHAERAESGSRPIKRQALRIRTLSGIY